MRQEQKYGIFIAGSLLAAVVLFPPAWLHGQAMVQTPLVGGPALPGVPATPPEERPLAINLLNALRLANVEAADIVIAAQRIKSAVAALDLAKAQWLPTITVGSDYYRHDGQNQDSTGAVAGNSRSGLMFGAGTGIGPAAILNINDAVFAPLVARQYLRAREADARAASNDTLVAVTDAYFTVQQARGELAGAIETTQRIEEVVRRTRTLAPSLVPELERLRAEAELARRQQAELLARERWGVASAELLRVLRLDPLARVEPLEPPHLRVGLIRLDRPVDELISLALLSRPELASQKAQVEATLKLLKQERLRPLVPSILLRGFSTPVTGTLAGGVFMGGSGNSIGNPGWRGDFDLQVLWQFDNLGFGNRAKIHQREADKAQATMALFRLEDRVAAEVSQAYTQAQFAARRVGFAEKGVQAAMESANKNLTALGQTRPVGGTVQLLIRPQEVVAAVQALAQAYLDYYGAVNDANRAQFRLYRALGHPAGCLIQDPPPSLPAVLPQPATQTANGKPN